MDATVDVRTGTPDARILDAGTKETAADGTKDSARDLAQDTGRDTARDTGLDRAKDLNDAKEGDATGDLAGDAIVDAPRDVPQDGAKDAPRDTQGDTVPDTRVNVCSDYTMIPMNVLHSDLKLSTTGASHHFDLPCATGGSGADIVVAFVLGHRELVYADTFGTPWNTVLSLSSACPFAPLKGDQVEGGVACSDDACGTSQSQIVALLDSGSYFIIISGANGESGDVTLHFQHAQVGSGPLAGLPAGTGSLTGTTSGRAKMVDVCEAPGPENSYWWLTCPDYAGGAFSASTCTGTAFDTVLALQIPRTDATTCVDNTDPCGTRSSMTTTIPPGAGLNLMTVAGGGSIYSVGDYQVSYTRP